MLRWLRTKCWPVVARRFRGVLTTSSFLAIFVLQSFYFEHHVFTQFLVANSAQGPDTCVNLDLAGTGDVYREGNLSNNKTRCFSRTLHNSTTLKQTKKRIEPKTKSLLQSDVFILVIESLSFQRFLDELPLTRSVLDEFGVFWFKGMHRRQGSTRENLTPLLFGEPVKYRKRLAHGNYSAVFNVSKKNLQDKALWRITEREGYQTLYGSTACNLLFGLHHISTNDGFVWHGTLEKYTDFTDSFPYGACYAKSESDCRYFVEAKTAKDMLCCDTVGPYHHEFF